ncbi:MAG: T9SS type A sorting domain-containing protein [Flavobacteriales bacterium]|nr:T9SS type A sorting domain-containing protein [Flavobacteriales bacterium]
MKLKQFFTLAAATFFFGAIVANAQTASLNATPGPFANLPHDCVAKTPSGSQVLFLNNSDVVTQSFTACTDGDVRKVYVKVKQTSGDGQLTMSILDSRGELLDKVKVTIKDGFSGVAIGKLSTKVEDGKRYNLKLHAAGVDLIIEGRYTRIPSNDLYLNGWKLDGSISTAIGFKHINEIDAVQASRDDSYNDQIDMRGTELASTFSTYPNPFSNDFTVEFEKDLKGQTSVVLLDLTGNVLHREIRTNVRSGDRININPRYFLNPGAYAVRVINEQRMFNTTIMKH